MATSPAIYSKVILEQRITGSWVEVNGVTNVGGPNATKEDIDISHMNSAAKEYKAARLADVGTFTYGLQYAPTNSVHAYIVSQSFNAGTGIDTFRVTWADNTKWGFSGSYTEFSITADNPSTGILTAAVSVKLSGAINFSES